MPLHILLILVVAGIGGIALLLHVSGRSQVAVLTEAAAAAGWIRHFPDDVVQEVRVGQDGRAALVLTHDGPGVIWVFGADTVARHLRDCDVSETGEGLQIDFHDYAAPRVTFVLTPGERADWQARIGAA